MRLKRRHAHTRLGPVRINRSGVEVTSVTIPIPWVGFSIVLWEKGRRR